MDAAHWPQGLGQLKPMEEMLMGAGANLQVQGSNPNPPVQAPSSALAPSGGAVRGGTPAMSVAGAGAGGAGAGNTERRARPQKEKAINCPRCNSTNTKFCYYNNYSLTQPRYFCKTCRRYWTEGGSLRNVPVGGGSRKNKRSSSSLSSASASASTSATNSSMVGAAAASNKNPKMTHEGAAHDLNLAFPHHHGGMQQAQAEYMAFPSLESSSMCNPGGGGTMGVRSSGALSAMELLRSTGCYMPLQVPMQMSGEYGAAGFTLGEFRAPPPPQSQTLLGFSLDAHGSAGYGSSSGMQGMQDREGRLLFPFEDLKPTASSGAGGGESGGGSGAGVDGGHHQFEQGNKEQQGNGVSGGQDTPVFWNGMIGGGTSW
ncbi:unnamed protein product [Alopecurus aequalis]